MISFSTKLLNHYKRFLRVNGFPYKCRFYGNSKFPMICIHYGIFEYSLCKNSFVSLGVSIDDFYEIRWSGLQPISLDMSIKFK